MSNARPLVSGFLASAERFADRPAVQIQDQALSYADLKGKAMRIAATLQTISDSAAKGTGHRLTGIFGHRSFVAFAGVLGTLLAGDAYVPLNPTFPLERTLQMIRRAGLTRIVVEPGSLAQLLPILEQLPEAIHVLAPDSSTMPEFSEACRHHEFLGDQELEDSLRFDASHLLQAATDPEQLAYLLFTSGSTGQPKGVMVTQSNVAHFVDCMVERYSINENDRFSQTFDLTFDLSAFDMFVAWERGACVCCPTQGEKMLPAKYVASQNITIWFSVPSTAIMMKKLRMLKPDSYPSIRYSLFCGEALPLEVAEAFQLATPNAVVENLYGPTELTIACTLYRYESSKSGADAEQGVVPIGEPYPNMEVLIVDENLAEVDAGESGELLMTGPQLTPGYWQDPEKTAAAFVVPPGQSTLYYRTGDRVRRGPDGVLLYLGRVDNQIKVQGYRVELGEIEALIRKVAKTDVAIAIGYPMGINGAEGIIAFKGESATSNGDISIALAERLPSYMQPRDLVTIQSFPLNSNGKVDRRALLESYQDAS